MRVTSRLVVAVPVMVAAMAAVALLPGPTSVSPAGAVATPGLNGKIAFTRSADGASDIFTMAPDGTGVTQITSAAQSSGGNAYQPAWSPDGTKLSYNRGGPQEAIWIVDADGSNPHALTSHAPGVFDLGSSWSPDGAHIVFVRYFASPPADGEIWVVNPDGTNPQRLAGPTELGCASGAMCVSSVPKYSPDSARILFSVRRAVGTVDDDLMVMNADGTNPQLLLGSTPTQDFMPDWAPDGTKIVFGQAPGGGGVAALQVVDANGTNQRALTSGNDSNPSWSPDGTTIVFARDADGPFHLYRIAAAGSPGDEVALGSTTQDDQSPYWQRIVAPVPPSSAAASITPEQITFTG
jgi:Tol biopolymer transport system component